MNDIIDALISDICERYNGTAFVFFSSTNTKRFSGVEINDDLDVIFYDDDIVVSVFVGDIWATSRFTYENIVAAYSFVDWILSERHA